MRRRFLWVLLALVGFAPLLVGAAIGGGGSGITNPIGCNDLGACVREVVNYALGLAGVLALAGIVYGGFLYITAGGSQDRIEAGKSAVWYSIIGLVVIGLSYAIIAFVFQALGGKGGPTQPGGGGGGTEVLRGQPPGIGGTEFKKPSLRDPGIP